MIPNHILNELKPGEGIAILSQGSEIHFHVHLITDTAEAVQAFAYREGSEVLTTHMQDRVAIMAFVVSRERDVGGEG